MVRAITPNLLSSACSDVRYMVQPSVDFFTKDLIPSIFGDDD